MIKIQTIIKIILLTISLAVLMPQKVFTQVNTVWAVGDGEKIFKFQTNHFAKHQNSIWDGHEVKLRGLYNEVLGFQIIVELDSSGSQSLEISMSPPIHQKSGKIIGGEGTIKYGSQGSVELFSQHYLQVKRPTEPHWFYGSKNSAPQHMLGWIPDALIPSNAKGKGGFPLVIDKTEKIIHRDQNSIKITEQQLSQNQGFWVDLYLPRDSAFPTGVYLSEISVWSNGKKTSSIPVEIELLNQYLPDDNHSNVWMYSSRNNALQYYFPDLSLDQINKMIKFEAHRHRIDLVGGFEAHGKAFDPKLMNAYKPYLDGTAFSPENGYHGPGQHIGEKLFTVGIYGEQVLGKTKESIQSESDKWVVWFEANAPNTNYFWYMIDEPGEVQYPWIKQNVQWIRSNRGAGSRLPIFLTTEYVEELKDDVDIWNGFQGIRDFDQFQLLKENGKDHWFYNGSRPFYGSVILEAAAVDLRVNGWIKYLFDINTWFVWHGTHWRHNMQGPKGRLYQRVFNDPLTFMNWSFNFGNGDGIMFYPGRMPYQIEEDRGLNLAMPSIKLKNIRRGQQDYELLWLAEQKIGKEKVNELIRRLVPKAMHEVEVDDPVYWSQRGDDYDEIRNKLLDILKN